MCQDWTVISKKKVERPVRYQPENAEDENDDEYAPYYKKSDK